MTKRAEVLVIIVSYNFERWMEKCLGSLQASEMPVDVVVIDNASSDNTVSRIRNEYPWVHLIANKDNLGFGKANNIGLSLALSLSYKGVFLLNQDAWIEQDVIKTLSQASDSRTEFGILSPLHFTGKGDKLDPGFAHYVEEASTGNGLIQTPFINAAIWYLPTEVVKAVGGFSPLFYHYGEDKDYVNRLHFHGYKVGYIDTIRGYHDREYRPVTREKYLRTEFVYHLSEYANPHRSMWGGFAYSVLACIKKALLSLCHGAFSKALAYLQISGKLLSMTSAVRRIRKQITHKHPHFLDS